MRLCLPFVLSSMCLAASSSRSMFIAIPDLQTRTALNGTRLSFIAPNPRETTEMQPPTTTGASSQRKAGPTTRLSSQRQPQPTGQHMNGFRGDD